MSKKNTSRDQYNDDDDNNNNNNNNDNDNNNNIKQEQLFHHQFHYSNYGKKCVRIPVFYNILLIIS